MPTLTQTPTSTLHSLVFEGLTEGVLVFGTDARLLDINTAACELLGVGKDLIGHKAEHVLPNWPHLAAQVAKLEVSVSVCVTLTDSWLELSLSPLADGGSLVKLRDVSAQKQLELSLQTEHAESEAKYRRLVEDAGDVIYMIDTAGYFSFGNAAVIKLGEYSLEEFVGLHFLKLVRRDHRDAIMLFYMQQLQNKEETSYYEFPLVSKSGKEYWMGQTVKLVRQAGRITGMQAVARDITDRILAEQELKRRTVELESANADLEKFAFIAAHDLQEPLRKIQAFGTRLEKTCGAELSIRGQDYLGRMLGSSRRMSLLIEDLLAFSQAGRQGRSEETVDLNTVAQSVLVDLSLRYDLSDVSIDVQALEKLSADPGQMRLLFLHLLDNAVKFRESSTAPRVKVGSSKNEDTFTLTVSDNGIGFDAQYTSKLFEVFQRLHHRDSYAGNGMGLAICRRIVEAHGGSLTASSNPGAGSTFSVVFPVALVREEG